MTSNFPGGPDTIVNNVTNTTPEVDTHPSVHNQLADAVMAVETALLPGGTMNLAAHVAATDPHPVYLTQVEGDALYAPIGGGGGGGAPSGPAGGALSGTYPNPTLAANSVATGNIIDGTIAAGDLAAGAAATNVGTLGGALTGSLPNPGLAALPANSVGSSQIVNGSVAAVDLAPGAAAGNIGTLGGALSGTLPNPGLAPGSVTTTEIADGTIGPADLAAGAAASNVGTLGGALTGTLPNPGLATGSVTTTQIQDGTIATADLANAAVTNAKLGTDTARLNLLTNGGFENWQRGAGPFTGNGVQTTDRWQTVQNGTGSSFSITRSNSPVDVPSSVYSAAIAYTRGTGIAAQTPDGIVQKLEDYGQYRGRAVSFSIRVQAAAANAVRIMVYDSVNGWTYAPTYHPGGSTWQTLTYTFTAPNNVASIFVGVSFDAAGTFYLDNAMLVVGSVPADYAPLHPADDLARCLRYYEVIGLAPNEFQFYAYVGAASQSVGYYVPYKAVKPVTATVTKVGTWTTTNLGQPALGAGGMGGLNFYATAAAAGVTYLANAAGCSFLAEANP